MTGDYPRNTGPMLSSPTLRGENALGQTLHVTGGKREETLCMAGRKVRVPHAATKTR
jgi:hypothetical protein